MIRYWKNNFCDGNRQDAMDLFLGNYQIQEYEDSNSSPLNVTRSQLIGQSVPMIMMVMTALMMLVIFMPARSGAEYLIFVAFCSALYVFVVRFFLKYGENFVNAPKLVHTKIKSE